MVVIIRYFVLVIALCAIFCEGRNKSPLIDDDQSVRRKDKAAECVFGKEVRELNSEWTPDLGVPIGILYCMRCQCVPIQKKRRRVARVQCRNIRSECPEPKCVEPVLLPGKCCKSCPGDTNNPDSLQDVIPQNVIEEEEKNFKHYVSLLTGKSSLNITSAPHKQDLNKNNVVATGRFMIHKRNLYYSFYISEKAARPRSLHFLYKDGTILEEFTLSHSGGLVNSHYQNATRKVCGVWTRVPRDYRQYLKHEEMYVMLIWGSKDTEFTLSGKVIRHIALASEQYSSLLEPAPGTDSAAMVGSGGTAIVSTSSSVSTSFHIAVIFNGLFTGTDFRDVPLTITLSQDERKIILQEDIRVSKSAPDLNLLELSSPLSQADLRLLTRGRLVLSISSKSRPESLRLIGPIITKTGCELFQTTLASSQADKNNPYGLAWVYLNNQGSLIYNIQVNNVKSYQRNPVVTLIDTTNKKRSELEELTRYLYDGWANGTQEKLTPKILDPLYSGKLEVNVDFGNATVIHGRLSSKPVADARDAPAPVLLTRENHTLPSSLVGLAWISVDNECHIHYDVTISGLNQDRKLSLYIEMYPTLAPGAPSFNKLLENFSGNQVEGSPVDSLTENELLMLESGYNFIKVKETDTSALLLASATTRVKLPISCRNSDAENNEVPNIAQPPPVLATEDCFFEEKFYKNDASWVSSSNPCQMCFCQNREHKCDMMTCPELSCPNNNKTEVIGECCPVCGGQELTNASSKKCIFNGVSYSPGSKFHPFLIPNGFDLYTECTCDPMLLEINCVRLNDTNRSSRKQLNNEKNTEREQNDDWLSPPPPLVPKVTKPANYADYILRNGGCRNPNDSERPYANGTIFHPSIASLGEYKCVTCKCSSGTLECRGQPCNWKSCKKLFELHKERRRNKKLAINSADYCCNIRECRQMRHRKKNEKTLTS